MAKEKTDNKNEIKENNKKAVIEVKNLEKIYDSGEVKVHALRGITLSVYDGELVAIMGTSGSGKSTLMNILGCLDKLTKGEYILDGRNVSNMSRDELADIRNDLIGFVFQGFNLLAKTPAIENVELPLLYSRARTYKKQEREEMAKKALDSVGLSGRYYHQPNQLSGGQQQRVAIARALIKNPSLILADEPTGNLDSRTSVEIMNIFQQMNRKNGITVVLVTHSDEIAEFADRVIVFRDGLIREDRRNANPNNAEEILKTMPVPEE